MNNPEWVTQLTVDLLDTFDPAAAMQRQIMCISEEAGELTGAVRRYLKMARREGAYEEVLMEAADVLISTMVLLEMCNANIDLAIKTKLHVIYQRGLRNW